MFFVWISDDLLAHTFRRFLRASPKLKRFGSAVPGPLEAQKRLAKRPITASIHGVTPSSIGYNDPIEPIPYLELNWKAPVSKLDLEINSDAPASSTASINPQKFNSWFEQVEPHPPYISKQSLSSQIQQLETFSQVEALKKSIDEDDDVSIDATTYSCQAFEALCRNGASFENLNRFLVDMSLAIPEAQIFSKFIQHSVRNPLAASELRTFVQTLKHALALGLILPLESDSIIKNIKQLVHLVHDRSRQSTPPSKALQDGLIEVYRSMWEGIKSCRVSTVDHRHPSFRILSELKGFSNTAELSYLKLEIFHTLWPMQSFSPAKNVLIEEQHFALAVIAIQENELSKAHVLDPSENENDSQNPHTGFSLTEFDRSHLVDALDCLQSENALDLVGITELLLNPSRHLHIQSDLSTCLEIWLSSLQASRHFRRVFMSSIPWAQTYSSRISYWIPPPWRSIYKALSKMSRISNLSRHLSTFGPRQINRLILEFWLPRYIQFQSDRPMSLKTAVGINKSIAETRARFEEHPAIGRSNTDAGISEYSNLLIAVSRSGLPCRRLMTQIFNLAYKRHGSQAVLRIAQDLRYFKVDIYPQPISQIIKQMPAEDIDIASQLYLVRTIRLAEFPDLLNHLVENYPSSHAMILAELGNPSLRSEKERIELAQLLAVKFSSHPYISNRHALRLVNKCYRMISPETHEAVSRSFVKAGLVRPLESGKWLSTERLLWMLGIVHSSEGGIVADELDELVHHWRLRLSRSTASSNDPPLENLKSSSKVRYYGNPQDGKLGPSYKRLIPRPGQPVISYVYNRNEGTFEK